MEDKKITDIPLKIGSEVVEFIVLALAYATICFIAGVIDSHCYCDIVTAICSFNTYFVLPYYVACGIFYIIYIHVEGET